MFSNLLFKTFRVGEKAFHVLSETGISSEDLRNFALDVLKFTNQIEDAAKAQQEQEKPPEEDQSVQPEEVSDAIAG